MNKYWIVLDTVTKLAENESGETIVSINDADGKTFVCEAVRIYATGEEKQDDSA